MKEKIIYTAIVRHKTSESLFINTKQPALKKELADWCRDFWPGEKELKGIDMPKDDNELINTYFEHVSSEEMLYRDERMKIVPVLTETERDVINDALELIVRTNWEDLKPEFQNNLNKINLFKLIKKVGELETEGGEQ